MEDVYVEQANFAGGVQPGTPADRLPDTAIASGINTAFRNIGSGVALLGCRPGLSVVNTTALSGSTSVQLDFARLYTYDTGSSFTNYLPVINRNGNLYYKNPDNTFTAEITLPSGWGYASGTKCFSAGDTPIDGTVFNNRLFVIKQSATPELRSVLGTTPVPWGLTPLATISITVNTPGGTTSLPAGTYDVAITSYNSTTGAESSLSATTTVTTAANDRISVAVTPTAAESALYTHFRVYLRQTSTQARFYLVSSLGTGGNNALTAYPATTTVYVNLTQAQITAQTTQAPSTVENAPPPTTARYVATYGRRLMLADNRNIYWSRQDKPDNFPAINYEPIETGEGDVITGIYPFSDEVLMVFTTTAIWGVFGNDPQTWTIKAIDHTIGCLSHLSIVEFNGNLGWWSDAYGPVYYNGNTITRLGERDLTRASYTTDLNVGRLDQSWAGHDAKYNRIVWAVPELGKSRNTKMFVYNYVMDRFESERWDPMPACCLSMGYHSDGSLKLFLGNDHGQLFYFDDTIRVDGVPSGTTTGTVAGATSLTTISGTGFYTTGSGLTGRWVLIVDEDYVPKAKVEISSNTATTLTLATAATLQPGLTYTYYIGSPDMRLKTRAYDMGRTFHRKRFDRLYFHILSPLNGAERVTLTTSVNFSDTQRAFGDTLTLGGAVWDAVDALWDTSEWVGVQNIKKRLSLFTHGQNMQTTLYQFLPGQDVVLSSVGVLAGVQSERYYG